MKKISIFKVIQQGSHTRLRKLIVEYSPNQKVHAALSYPVCPRRSIQHSCEKLFTTYLVSSESKSLIHLLQTRCLKTLSSQRASFLKQLVSDAEEGCGKCRLKIQSHRCQQPPQKMAGSSLGPLTDHGGREPAPSVSQRAQEGESIYCSTPMESTYFRQHL